MTTSFDQVGPYEILGELGAGAMGRVYYARNTVLNRPVALKIVRADLVAAADAEHRLRQEGRAAASLSHPNIVGVLEVGEHDGRFYLAMDLIRGESLAERVVAGPSYGPLAAAELLAKLARAVDHAHQHGILHRDLKPSNILLDEVGEPHLTDFGLAKFMTVETGLTVTNAPLGTCGYMAPEVALEGARASTIASDVYGLGAVLYELIAGRPPYASSSYSEFLRQIEKHDPPPPTALRLRNQTPATEHSLQTATPSAAERDLELICLHCLQREPGKRYPSAGALAGDLERLLRGEPVTVRAPRRYELAAVWLRRHKLVASAGLAVALALLAGLATTLWQLRRAERFLTESRQSNAELRHQDVRRSLQAFHSKSTDGFPGEALHELTLLYRRYPTNRTVATRLWTTLLERPHLLRRLPGLSLHGEGTDATFTADGAWLITGSISKTSTVQVWNLASGDKQGEVQHDLYLMPLATDRLGTRLVTIDASARVHVWSLPDLIELAGSWTNLTTASQASLSGSGEVLAVTHGVGKLTTWELGRGGPLWEAEVERGPHRLCFSGDDRALLVAGESGRATVFTTRKGETQAGLDSAMGPLSRVIASPSGDGFLRVGESSVRFDTYQSLHHTSFELALTNETVRSAALSADGQFLAVASSKGWLREFRLQTRTATPRCLKLGGSLDAVGYSPTDGEIAVSTGDGVVWFLPADPERRRPQPVKAGVFAFGAQFSPDGRSLAVTVYDGFAHVYYLPPRLEAEPVRLTESNAVLWAVSPSGNAVAMLDSQNRIGLRGLEPGASFEPWFQASTEVRSLDFSPSGRWLLVRDNRGRCQVVSVSDPHGSGFMLEHAQRLQPAFAFSQSETRLLLATESQVHVWNLEGHQAVHEAVFDVPKVSAMVLSPDGNRLALTCATLRGELYDTRTWQRLPASMDHPGPVGRLQFSEDSRWIATGSQDRTARVWRASDGTPVSPVLQNGFDGLCMAFHPSGQQLFTGGGKGAIRRWQIPGGEPESWDVVAMAPPHFLTCSANGRWLLSAGGGFTEAWDLETGSPLLDPIRVYETAKGWAMTPPRFATDGKHFLVVEPAGKDGGQSDEGTISVIRLPSYEDLPAPEALMALAQLSLDGLLNETGGLTMLDTKSLAELYRQADPILRVTRPTRIRQMHFYKPGAR